MTDTAAAATTPHVGQDGYAYRFDWGWDGLRALAPLAAVVVIVDVLRFTTAVCAATDAGATVLPYPWADAGAAAYAGERGAVLAGRRELGEPSLSPADLLGLATGTRIVLPSPNGSALAFAARDLGATHVLAGSLRNATATAARALELAGEDRPIAVIAAGERWHDTSGPLRPSVEDLWGAGAVLAALDPAAAAGPPCCSPEAGAARAAFLAARPLLHDGLAATVSGRELIALGWQDDVAIAAAHDASPRACELVGDAFVAS